MPSMRCSQIPSQRFRFSVLFFSFVLSTTTFSQKVFDFNSNCKQAYKEIIQLRLNSGQKILDSEKTRNPNNLIPFFLENYIDFFVLFFNEDPAEYRKRIIQLEKRLALFNDGPVNSPFYLFTKSVIHFQWAAVRVKFGYTWDAGWQFRRSFLQVKENLTSFPAFSPPVMYNGAMQVTIGTVPDGYKWISNLFGMKGSIKNGMVLLKNFLNSKDEWATVFHDEAMFYYLYLKFYVENDKEGVSKLINDESLDLKNNHLFTYLAANLSINNQQSEKAKKIISERNNSSDYMVTPIWDLEMGYARLNHLENDAAFYFERFLSQFKGKFYVKDAFQKLSWHFYLKGDQKKAEFYRGEILKNGSTDTEADKQAEKEARTEKWPNKLLLQVRLLNDGGYHEEALGFFYGKKGSDFTLPEEKLEFAYRVGRLYDDVGREKEAIRFYREAILLGEKRKEYFAARAALQIGYILEKNGDKKSATDWFVTCLNMKDHDFKNSLDQKAKAGIRRCSE